MRNYKLWSAVATVMLTAGCATSSMSDSNYQRFGSMAGYLQKCFDAGYINSQLYADAKNALSYVVSTWSYDRERLEAETSFIIRNGVASPQICRQTEADAYQVVSATGRHRADSLENQRTINDAINAANSKKPVYCNTIGTVTMCN